MSANQPTRGSVMLPTEHERKQIFYWLKQISSYTAWNRIFGFYQAWANAAEHCARLMSEQGVTDPPKGPASDYKFILNGLTHCEEAVLRLKKGDKRIFKFDAKGELAMAGRPLSHWGTYLTRIEWREHPEHNDSNTPGWGPFHQAFKNLEQTWRECSEILENQWLDVAAPTVYGVWFQENLPKMPFPAVLPDVPNPREDVLVPTGKAITCSGIWEPVDAPKPKRFSLFRSDEKPVGPFPIIGCMNYLHGGSAAPKATLETDDDNPEVDTVWRLLWRDTRYEDGTIPDEERDYVFLQPETPEEEARPVASSNHDPFIWAETGQPAPQSGRWLAEHDLQASVTLQAGEVLPLHQGRPTRWVLAQA